MTPFLPGALCLVLAGFTPTAAAPQTPDVPAAAARVTPPRNPALRDLLRRLVQADQAVRARALANPRLAPGKPLSDPAALALIQQWVRTDRDNTEAMKRILYEYGWPGKSLVGEDGAHDAWLLVQHADSDRAFQKRCLVLIQRAAAKGEASKIDLAYLTDRILVAENKPQRYGTQFRQAPTGEMIPYPIEDEANVDARRRSAGMPTLASYKEKLLETYVRAKPAPGSSGGTDTSGGGSAEKP